VIAVPIDHIEEFGLVQVIDGEALVVSVPYPRTLWDTFCGHLPDPNAEPEDCEEGDDAYWEEHEYRDPKEVIAKFIADVGEALRDADYRLWTIADVREHFGKLVEDP